MGRTGSLHTGSLSQGVFFGIPLAGLGWFGSLLIALASGFLAFFATTFLAIFAILFYNAATHSAIDFALSYRRVGLPCGLVVLTIASLFLGRLWVARVFRRS